MFDVIGELNWLAIIVATLGYYILGAIWFTPLFGKAYDKATGVQRKKGQKWSTIYYVGPLINCLLVSLTTAVLIYALHVEEFSDAMLLGNIVGFGYLASITFNNAVIPNMPKPLLFGLITGAYHVFGAVSVAGIIFMLK
jgi:hypothetical protein